MASFINLQFGGSQGAALMPNLNVGRKPATKPISCTSDSSGMSNTVTSTMTRRTPSPARSPRKYIQTVSTLSLPPSPVSTTTSSIQSVAEVSSAASSSGTSSAPLAPVTSASATATSFFVTSAAPSVVGRSAHPTTDIETAPGSEPGWLPAKLMGPYHLRIRSGFHLLCGRTSSCALT